MIFTKKMEGVRAIRAIKYKKKKAGKYIRACAPLARKNTNPIFESKDGATSTQIVNKIERHNFCVNDLLTKSNRTEIQTYKIEKRTFGTPCIPVPTLCIKAGMDQLEKLNPVMYRMRVINMLELDCERNLGHTVGTKVLHP